MKAPVALSSEAGTHRSEFIGMALLSDQDSGVRRQLQKGKKKDGVSPVFFTNSCRLHTSGRLGKTSHFAGSLARSGGEEFVNFLQFVAGILGKNTNHGGNAVLFVVILQEVKNLLMVGSDSSKCRRNPSSSTSKVLPLNCTSAMCVLLGLHESNQAI